MTKREIKTLLIIDTAFKIWGENSFYSTSLSSLAEALSMTKPAIYRYFKNKEALLQAMKDNFIFKYQTLLKESNSSKNLTIDQLIKDYTEISVKFFAENYNYYRFFVLVLLNMNKDIDLLFNDLKGNNEHFLSPELLQKIGFSEIESLSISGYILSVSGFLLNQHLFTKKTFTKKEIVQMIKVIRYISRFGFTVYNNKKKHINYENIEKISKISIEDVLPFNKIFTAVAEVIADKGIWNTTVDSIAEHLEMSKSSLYFYFDNKEQMIQDVIGSERERLNELILERIVKFESYEEQLYCIFYVMSSYFLVKPAIFTIMNWLRYQFFNNSIKQVDHKLGKFSEYITLLTNTTSFNPIGFQSELIAEGLGFILIQGLWECMNNNSSHEKLNFRIRKIHQLLLYGLKGV